MSDRQPKPNVRPAPPAVPPQPGDAPDGYAEISQKGSDRVKKLVEQTKEENRQRPYPTTEK